MKLSTQYKIGDLVRRRTRHDFVYGLIVEVKEDSPTHTLTGYIYKVHWMDGQRNLTKEAWIAKVS